MAKRSNNFDGGSNGTTITIANSSAGGQDTLNYVGIGTGSTLTYSNAQAHSGSLAARVAPASGQNAYVQFGGSTGNLASEDTAVDFWMYHTANPGADMVLLHATRTDGAREAQVGMLANGHIRVRTLGATWLWTSTAAIPLNTWLQVRLYMRNQGMGTSFVKAALYNGATLVEDFSTSTADRSAPIAGVGVGKTSIDAAATVFWTDDFEVETAATGYIDEEAPAVAGTVGMTIDARSSTGDITNWAISHISGPSGSATAIEPGLWQVPIPEGEAAVWRVTITVTGGQTFSEDFTVEPAGSGGSSAPVVMMYRAGGEWV